MEGLWGEGEAGTGEVLAMVSIRYRVMSGLMCGDEAPGTRTRDKWVTGWPHPLLHPPITAPGAMIAGLQVGAGVGDQVIFPQDPVKESPSL